MSIDPQGKRPSPPGALSAEKVGEKTPKERATRKPLLYPLLQRYDAGNLTANEVDYLKWRAARRDRDGSYGRAIENGKLRADLIADLLTREREAADEISGIEELSTESWADRHAQLTKELGGMVKVTVKGETEPVVVAFWDRLTHKEQAARVHRWLREARPWKPKSRTGIKAKALGGGWRGCPDFEQRVLAKRHATSSEKSETHKSL